MFPSGEIKILEKAETWCIDVPAARCRLVRLTAAIKVTVRRLQAVVTAVEKTQRLLRGRQCECTN